MCKRIYPWRRYLLISGLLFIMCMYGSFWFKAASQTSFFTSSASLIPGVAGGTGFVKRSGTMLLLGKQLFRFSGTNIYWLGLQQQDDGNVLYPSHFQVDDALATASFMGATVVRAHTLGISVGCRLCLEPSRGYFNEVAFQHIDYALQSAQKHHLKVIIPLVDNWHYYHGGKHTFTDWRGVSNEQDFYTDTLVIQDFEDYIHTILNHVNIYTGVAYKNDPTILAWETGNELSAPLSWVQTICTYIKTIDTYHLLMDGNYESEDALNNFLPDLHIAAIDIYSGHYYPPTIGAMQTEFTQVNDAHKVFIVGEYDWNTVQGDELKTFLLTIENSHIAGDLYWTLFPHNDSHGFFAHNEHYALDYPGATPVLRERIRLLVNHVSMMSGRAIPSAQPGIPLITTIHTTLITWRGAYGADTYSIERSTGGLQGPWVEICHRCVTDYISSWKDTTQPSVTVQYRIRGYSVMDIPGPYSPIHTVL